MSTTFGQATSIDIEFCNHISGGARPRDWAPIPEYHRRSMSPIPQNSQNFSGHRRVRSGELILTGLFDFLLISSHYCALPSTRRCIKCCLHRVG